MRGSGIGEIPRNLVNNTMWKREYQMNHEREGVALFECVRGKL